MSTLHLGPGPDPWQRLAERVQSLVRATRTHEMLDKDDVISEILERLWEKYTECELEELLADEEKLDAAINKLLRNRCPTIVRSILRRILREGRAEPPGDLVDWNLAGEDCLGEFASLVVRCGEAGAQQLAEAGCDENERYRQLATVMYLGLSATEASKVYGCSISTASRADTACMSYRGDLRPDKIARAVLGLPS